MKIQFKVVEITDKETYSVAKLEPSLVDARVGDSVAGTPFLTTSLDNKIFKMGDIVAIELVPAEVVEEPVV